MKILTHHATDLVAAVRAVALATALLSACGCGDAAGDAPCAAGATLARADGGVAVDLGAERWTLSLLVSANGLRLDESPETRLGYRRDGHWYRAVALENSCDTGDEITATAITDDPEGGTLGVTVTRHDDGSASLVARASAGARADAVGVGFLIAGDEAFYGFGERMNGSQQRGATIVNKVEDGPYTAEQCAIVGVAVPDWAKGCRPDSTYFPLPWLISSRGFGFLANNNEVSRFDLGAADSAVWTFEVDAAELRFRVFPGPTPAQVLERATAVLGRQPPLVAPWQLGVWASPHSRQEVELLHAADVPMSAAEYGGVYLPCGGRIDSDEARTANDDIRTLGVASLAYVAGYLCNSNERLFAPAHAAGALQVDANGEPYSFRGSGFSDDFAVTFEPVTQFDFTVAAGRDFFTGVLEEPVSNGVDGWMEDFGEYTPYDTVPGDPAIRPDEVPNLQPTHYHCAAHAWTSAPERPRALVRYQRSGWIGSAPCADVVWSGDPTSTFGFTGIGSQVNAAISMGLSGITRWHSDIGGYRTFPDDPQLTPELLLRWIEWSAFTTIMRPKAGALTLPPYRRPRVSDPEILPTWRRYAKLHTQLYPYMLAADAEYLATGMPLVRHMILEFPDDPEVLRVGDQHLFGRDLLVAPVLTAGARERELYVPAGRWIDWQRSVAYDEATGGFHLRRVATVAPGRRTLPAGLGEIPLLVRSGALLPLLSPDVDTLTDFGEDVVKLRDRLDRLHVLAFPDGESHSAMFEGESMRSSVSPGVWQLEIDGPPRRYMVEASIDALVARCPGPFVPGRVTVEGRELPSAEWSFDADAAVLRMAFETGSGSVVVTEGHCT